MKKLSQQQHQQQPQNEQDRQVLFSQMLHTQGRETNQTQTGNSLDFSNENFKFNSMNPSPSFGPSNSPRGRGNEGTNNLSGVRTVPLKQREQTLITQKTGGLGTQGGKRMSTTVNVSPAKSTASRRATISPNRKLSMVGRYENQLTLKRLNEQQPKLELDAAQHSARSQSNTAVEAAERNRMQETLKLLDKDQIYEFFQHYGKERLSSERIKDNLILLSISLMQKELDTNLSIPRSLEQNKLIWARLMFENKRMQEIISSFTATIKEIMEKEIKHKRDKLTEFLKQIRAPDMTQASGKQYLESVRIKLNSRGSSLRAVSPTPKSSIPDMKGNESPQNHKKSGAGKAHLPFSAIGSPTNHHSSTAHNFHEDSALAQLTELAFNYMKNSSKKGPGGVEKQLIRTGSQIKNQRRPSFRFISSNPTTSNLNISDHPEKDDPSYVDPTKFDFESVLNQQPITTYFQRMKAVEKIQKKYQKEIARKRQLHLIKTDISKVDKLIEDLEIQNDVFAYETTQATESIDPQVKYFLYLQNIDPERAAMNMRSKAIDYLYDWRAKPMDSWNDIQKWWSELWKSKEEFEEELIQEQKGFHLEMKYQQRKADEKLLWVKQKAALYLESLESAHLEKEISYRREIERLTMILADIESKEINNTMSFDEIENLLRNKPDIKTLSDAANRLSIMERAVRSQQYQIKDCHKDLENLRYNNGTLKAQVKNLESLLEYSKRYKEAFWSTIQATCNPELGEEALLRPERYEAFSTLVNEKDEQEVLKVLEADNMFERIKEELAYGRQFKIGIREVRKAIRSLGVLQMKEFLMNDNGESVKVSKAVARTLQDELNHPTVVAYFNIDLAKEALEKFTFKKQPKMSTVIPKTSIAKQKEIELEKANALGGTAGGTGTQLNPAFSTMSNQNQSFDKQSFSKKEKKSPRGKKPSMSPVMIKDFVDDDREVKRKIITEKYKSLKPSELSLNQDQVDSIVNNLTSLQNYVDLPIPLMTLQNLKSSTQANRIVHNINEMLINTTKEQQEQLMRRNRSMSIPAFSPDRDSPQRKQSKNVELLISDIINLEEQAALGGAKAIVLNQEAFSLFLHQNKNNQEPIKKLFEDVVAINQILTGQKPTSFIQKTEQDSRLVDQEVQAEGQTLNKFIQTLPVSMADIEADYLRNYKPPEDASTQVKFLENDLQEKCRAAVELIFSDCNKLKNLQLFDDQVSYLEGFDDFFKSIEFEVVGERRCSLQEILSLSFELIQTRLSSSPQISLEEVFSEAMTAAISPDQIPQRPRVFSKSKYSSKQSEGKQQMGGAGMGAFFKGGMMSSLNKPENQKRSLLSKAIARKTIGLQTNLADPKEEKAYEQLKSEAQRTLNLLKTFIDNSSRVQQLAVTEGNDMTTIGNDPGTYSHPAGWFQSRGQHKPKALSVKKYIRELETDYLLQNEYDIFPVDQQMRMKPEELSKIYRKLEIMDRLKHETESTVHSSTYNRVGLKVNMMGSQLQGQSRMNHSQMIGSANDDFTARVNSSHIQSSNYNNHHGEQFKYKLDGGDSTHQRSISTATINNSKAFQTRYQRYLNSQRQERFKAEQVRQQLKSGNRTLATTPIGLGASMNMTAGRGTSPGGVGWESINPKDLTSLNGLGSGKMDLRPVNMQVEGNRGKDARSQIVAIANDHDRQLQAHSSVGLGGNNTSFDQSQNQQNEASINQELLQQKYLLERLLMREAPRSQTVKNSPRKAMDTSIVSIYPQNDYGNANLQ